MGSQFHTKWRGNSETLFRKLKLIFNKKNTSYFIWIRGAKKLTKPIKNQKKITFSEIEYTLPFF